MARLGLGLGRVRARTGIGVSVPTAPAGFVRNGSTNATLAAMLARVAAGTGRGTIVVKGDSTSAGAGAGGSGDVVTQLTGARAGRVSATLAAALSAHGYPALDNAVVGDNGCDQFGVWLPGYDPRVSYAGDASTLGNGGQAFAGGNYLYPLAPIDFTPTTPVDRFVIVAYRTGGTYTITVDGVAPAAIAAPGADVTGNMVTVPDSGGGFVRMLVTAAGPGIRTVRVTPGGTTPLLRSIQAYDGAAAAIDILNHASSGAGAADQAAAGDGWRGNDALGLDAPDLAIVNLGLNDTAMQVPVATYIDALGTIVTRARVSGDVLLVFPHPAGGPFATGITAYRDAAAALAAEQGVAFLSLFDHFGGAFTPALQARMAD